MKQREDRVGTSVGAALRRGTRGLDRAAPGSKTHSFQKEWVTSWPVFRGVLEGQTAMHCRVNGQQWQIHFPLHEGRGLTKSIQVLPGSLEFVGADHDQSDAPWSSVGLWAGVLISYRFSFCLLLVGMNPGLSHGQCHTLHVQTLPQLPSITLVLCPKWSCISLGSQPVIPETLLTQTLWVGPLCPGMAL